MAIPVAREHFPDRQLNSLQETALGAAKFLNSQSLLPGVKVTAAFTGAATTAFVHGLTKTPQGWLVIDSDAATTLYRSAWDAQTITLVSSGAVNAVLWVF